MTIPALDIHEFTRRGDTAGAREPIASFERLGSLLVATDGEIAWRVEGRSAVGHDGARQAFLHLSLDARPCMRCVRCLEPIEVTLGLDREFRFVSNEAQAKREDADDDELDVLVASRRFDLAALVEDEAIMALPPAPRHDDCRAPQIESMPPPLEPQGSADGRPNPFAVLGALRADPSDVPPAPADDEEGSPGEAGSPGSR